MGGQLTEKQLFHQLPRLSKKIRLIATDVDGTLLNPNHQVSPEAYKVLKALPTPPTCHFLIVTGKTRYSVLPILETVFPAPGDRPPSIHLNGLITYAADGSVLTEYCMTPDVAADTLDLAQRENIPSMVCSGMDLLSPHDHAYNTWIERFGEPHVHVDADLVANVRAGKITCHKILLFGTADEVKRLRKTFPAHDAVRPHFVSDEENRHLEAVDASKLAVTAAVPQVMEIMPAGCSKAVALRDLCAKLDVAQDEVVALGDGENDVDMLRWAGTGIAMGNAVQKAKDAADYVTKRNDENGFAVAVGKILAEQWDGPSTA